MILDIIKSHLPVLVVVVPLISAPIALLLRRERLAWSWTVLVTWFTFVMSAMLLARVLSSGVLSYHLGGWAPPLGIEYRVDYANALVIFLVSIIGALVATYARKSIQAEIPPRNWGLFYVLYLLCFAGLIGVAVTGDAFNLFVFLEISSLSTYTMVSMGGTRDRRAYTAAIRYLIAGTLGATFFVIGVGLLYMVTGTLNMADLADKITHLEANRTVRTGFAFIVIGIGLKLAMFPMHLWLPNAYTYAPSVVTAFVASTSTKVAVYALIRFMFSVSNFHYEFEHYNFTYLILPLAIAGMFIPSLVAVFQVDVKRLFAYSSIAQVGYMLVGVALASEPGLTASLVHLFNHALMKGALFMALGVVMMRVGSTLIHDMAGLGRQMPWTMAAFVGGGLSLIGVPLTVGFVSKWLLVSAAFDAGMWWLAALIIISSLIAFVYVWRVIEVVYIEPAPAGRVAKEAPFSMLVPLWVLVLANFYFGINTHITIDAATRAADLFIGAGQ